MLDSTSGAPWSFPGVIFVRRVQVVAQCDFCGKSKMFGRNVRYHHGGKWELRAPKTNRTFEPNVQRTRILVKGHPKRVHICTRCLRTQQKTA